MKRLTVLLFLCISAFFPVYSQEAPPPITWGDIPRADLEMTSFPGDTNATAVILCDYGESHFNDDLDIVYTGHMRIKILNQKGYDWGTHHISINTKDRVERVEDIEGITYMLKPDGQIEKTKLDDDDIFKEEVTNNRVLYKFTMPNLQPGCIIEIRYKIISKSLFYLRDWTFQLDEPVRWSEYRVRVPQAIAYAFVTLGYEPFYINTREEISQYFSGEASYLLGNSMCKCEQYQWVIKDIPALREEPYITTVGDYRSELQVQLAGYSLVGTGKQLILNTWDNVVERLLKDDEFTGAIDDTREVKKIALEITKELNTDEDKMKAIYNWVSNSIVCVPNGSIFTKQDVDDVIEYKKGSSTEISVLLLSLLKAVGIQGSPVLLSTRNNGAIQKIYPIISQFNYVIARVNIGTNYYLLDATDPFRPYDLLPDKVLNVQGLIIKEGPVEWVQVKTEKKNNTGSLAVLTIKEDGTITGTLEDSYTDYTGLNTRSKLNEKKDYDLAKEIFDTESLGLSIDSVFVTGKDSIQLPLKIKSWISSESYTQKNGDMIYFNPSILHRVTENPFKSSKRTFPVDYAYKRGLTTVINLTIPDGYEVIEKLIPKGFYVENAASFTRQVLVDSNNVQIVIKFDIKEPVIKPAYYERLKSFYAQIITAESEQLVLGPKKVQQVEIPINSATVNSNPAPINKNTSPVKKRK